MLTDKYMVVLFVCGTMLFVIFVFFLIAYLLVQKNKQNTFHLDKQRMIYSYQNKLLSTKLEEQETVMDQLSKEIHDNVGQILSFLKMNTTVIRKFADNAEQLRLIDRHDELLAQVMTDIKNISHTLNSDHIKGRGLYETLKKEMDYLGATKNIDCTITLVGAQNNITPEQQLIIYRIAQEAIHNTVKHANATAISISLNFGEDSLEMKVSDNGVGFAKDKVFSFDGVGFINMFNRAKFLNGTLDIVSEPGQGCTITLTTRYDIKKDGDKREDFLY